MRQMRHLILGSSAAAIAAADVLRQARPEDSITLASADERVHSRCLLHRYLSGERDVESLDFTRQDFLSLSNIDIIEDSPALSVDIEKKAVHFESSTVQYDKLLIATGSNHTIPRISGLSAASNVFTLGSLLDASKIKKEAEKAQLIAIIGSGFVGMSAAYGLKGCGAFVHVVEAGGRIIPAQLDRHVASIYQKRFEQAGVTFFLEKNVVAVTLYENGRAAALEFEGRQMLPCDMIVVATGSRPNIGFLEGSGIKLGNGVTVDRHMQTSVADVYSAGDVTGLSGSWHAAIKQGRVAGHNMANPGSVVYEDDIHTARTINFFGIPTVSIGNINPPEDEFDEYEFNQGVKYMKLILKDGVAVGALLSGDIANAGHWKYLIKNAVPLDKLNKSPAQVEYADFFEIDQNTAEFRYNFDKAKPAGGLPEQL